MRFLGRLAELSRLPHLKEIAIIEIVLTVLSVARQMSFLGVEKKNVSSAAKRAKWR